MRFQFNDERVIYDTLIKILESTSMLTAVMEDYNPSLNPFKKGTTEVSEYVIGRLVIYNADFSKGLASTNWRIFYKGNKILELTKELDCSYHITLVRHLHRLLNARNEFDVRREFISDHAHLKTKKRGSKYDR